MSATIDAHDHPVTRGAMDGSSFKTWSTRVYYLNTVYALTLLATLFWTVVPNVVTHGFFGIRSLHLVIVYMVAAYYVPATHRVSDHPSEMLCACRRYHPVEHPYPLTPIPPSTHPTPDVAITTHTLQCELFGYLRLLSSWILFMLIAGLVVDGIYLGTAAIPAFWTDDPGSGLLCTTEEQAAHCTVTLVLIGLNIIMAIVVMVLIFIVQRIIPTAAIIPPPSPEHPSGAPHAHTHPLPPPAHQSVHLW